MLSRIRMRGNMAGAETGTHTVSQSNHCSSKEMACGKSCGVRTKASSW